jgi:hypothetical protein
MRLLIFVSMFAFMACVISASCSTQIVSLGSHNISLDFGGQNITVMPVTSAYECCLGVDTNYTKMVDKTLIVRVLRTYSVTIAHALLAIPKMS